MAAQLAEKGFTKDIVRPKFSTQAGMFESMTDNTFFTRFAGKKAVSKAVAKIFIRVASDVSFSFDTDAKVRDLVADGFTVSHAARGQHNTTVKG